MKNYFYFFTISLYAFSPLCFPQTSSQREAWKRFDTVSEIQSELFDFQWQAKYCRIEPVATSRLKGLISGAGRRKCINNQITSIVERHIFNTYNSRKALVYPVCDALDDIILAFCPAEAAANEYQIKEWSKFSSKAHIQREIDNKVQESRYCTKAVTSESCLKSRISAFGKACINTEIHDLLQDNRYIQTTIYLENGSPFRVISDYAPVCDAYDDTLIAFCPCEASF